MIAIGFVLLQPKMSDECIDRGIISEENSCFSFSKFAVFLPKNAKECSHLTTQHRDEDFQDGRRRKIGTFDQAVFASKSYNFASDINLCAVY